ncbi:MAG: methionyl-tRNA formyltransferase [Clostridiales bacterium 43-6]|nr:MAG: methionyl-tRNA formyltransferase [Clostridiales bacterium 43-6]
MNIVYMGTPGFAVPPLEALIGAGHRVQGVFTMPDKPKGRGYALTPTPVKECALAHHLTVYQNNSMRDGEALKILQELNPELIVVVAYGKILPKEILQLPKYGCVNVHASLLPKYRGASPVQWSIVCGETQTGVTTMLLDEGMDTGDILQMRKIAIGPDETAEELMTRLCDLGAELLLSTLTGLESGAITPVKQDSSEASYAPIIKKEDGLIDWTAGAQSIHNLARGLRPWPTAYTILEGKLLKIFKTAVLGTTDKKAGTVTEARNSLIVACGDGIELEITELQLEGSKRMAACDMLRGRKIESGTLLG